MRRFALLFGLMLLLSGIGAATVVSTLIGRTPTGWIAVPSPLIIVVVLFVLALVLLSFRGGMQRVGLPFGDIVASADRVAQGDYSARVVERGPPFLRVIARAFNSMTARLQAQDRQRRELMADIAHELRTPLAVIQARLEGLLDGVYPMDAAQLTHVLEDTRVLARLVEDLRTLANAEAGNLSLRKEPTDFAVLMHDAAAAFATEAQSRTIALRVDDGGELPLVEIDPLRVREVLTNVLANAMRHTPDGGSISALAAHEDGRIVVRVTDTGSGIAPEDLPKIFDRFYKHATSTGSGLGLTIARGLIAAHGGEMRAESALGRGTTITFTLPIAARNAVVSLRD